MYVAKPYVGIQLNAKAQIVNLSRNVDLKMENLEEIKIIGMCMVDSCQCFTLC